MALKLSLKPGEKIAINGAVIVNGERRSSFVVQNRASILRDRDIMQIDEATSPAKRIYLPVMMMALDPIARGEMLAEFEQRLTEFAGAITDREMLETCLNVSAHVANQDFYKALSACRTLIEFEKARLSDVA